MNLNDVKAGKYELIARRWDQVLSKPGEPFDYKRHRKGDIVDLNVDDARRLVKAGAVRKPGKAEPAALPAPPPPADPPAESDKVKDILARVGTDKALAEAALEKEKAKEPDDQRSSLVEKLEGIITDPGEATS